MEFFIISSSVYLRIGAEELKREIILGIKFCNADENLF